MHSIIPLSIIQVEILSETVESFVDNHKLLHVPDQRGEIVGLPLTSKALQFIHTVMKEKEVTEKQDVTVEVKSGDANGSSQVIITLCGASMQYEVELEEFDSM
ncbi:hypothetical protein [Ammoniphilus sp. CFH 90114]|uniref:hypothetical protein n=1 Tax=Ammoniphilus sp. CFH 90114 TaxID=2493665 RepID=UPI00100FF4EB|nr:hypothetical protein [Ammoniphilus sp. CFH 90114]RXT05660.1 hypothetical protein EIZ39_16235 [Ammoniphilus sp. CFH 90114]